MPSQSAGVRVGPYTMYTMQVPAGATGQFPPYGGRFLNGDGQTCGTVAGNAGYWLEDGEFFQVAPQSYAIGMNDRGEVIGMTSGDSSRGFYWGRSLQFLDGFQMVWNINNHGVITGTCDTDPPRPLTSDAALWVPGTGLVRLASGFPAGTLAQAVWVNEKREAVGLVGDYQRGKPWYWYPDGGSVRISDSLAVVTGINNFSQVVGLLNASAAGGNPFFWNGYNRAAPEFQMVPGRGADIDICINEHGMIAGCGDAMAYRWYRKNPKNTKHPKPAKPNRQPVGIVSDINSSGAIAGWVEYNSPNSTTLGLVWNPDNSFVELGVGTKALAINDQGMVAGTSNGQPVLWVPTP